MADTKRQIAWQQKQIALGNCPQCGKPNKSGKRRCDPCRVKDSKFSKIYYQNHKQELREYQKKYRERNRDKAKDYARNYYQNRKLANLRPQLMSESA